MIHSGDEPDEVLHHTLYRYLVLCGISEEVWAMHGTSSKSGGGRSKTKNTVWNTVVKLIGPREALTGSGKGGRGAKVGRWSLLRDVSWLGQQVIVLAGSALWWT